MDKEEILEKHLGRYMLKVSDISHGTNAIPGAIKSAMDEYAKQIAIAFADWLSDHPSLFSSATLFELFLTEISI